MKKTGVIYGHVNVILHTPLMSIIVSTLNILEELIISKKYDILQNLKLIHVEFVQILYEDTKNFWREI